MATRSSSANPIANFYEAQTVATAEIANAALNGMQRLQKLTLQALRAGAGEQLSLAQSMASMRDGGNISRSVSEAAAPAAEQGARYQREMVQAIAEMNNDIVRASYSMMERMRDALGRRDGRLDAVGLTGPAGARRRHDKYPRNGGLRDAPMADGGSTDDGNTGGRDGCRIGTGRPPARCKWCNARKAKRPAKRKSGAARSLTLVHCRLVGGHSVALR